MHKARAIEQVTTTMQTNQSLLSISASQPKNGFNLLAWTFCVLFLGNFKVTFTSSTVIIS